MNIFKTKTLSSDLIRRYFEDNFELIQRMSKKFYVLMKYTPDKFTGCYLAGKLFVKTDWISDYCIRCDFKYNSVYLFSMLLKCENKEEFYIKISKIESFKNNKDGVKIYSLTGVGMSHIRHLDVNEEIYSKEEFYKMFLKCMNSLTNKFLVMEKIRDAQDLVISQEKERQKKQVLERNNADIKHFMLNELI